MTKRIERPELVCRNCLTQLSEKRYTISYFYEEGDAEVASFCCWACLLKHVQRGRVSRTTSSYS